MSIRDFDLRKLWRTLASTQAYQLSSQHDDPEAAAPQWFARMLSKSLTPEQLYDSLIVLAPPAATGGMAYGSTVGPASILDEDPARIEFVRRMRPPPGSVDRIPRRHAASADAHERPYHNRNDRSRQQQSAGALDSPFMTDEDQVESLFLATLARRPDSEEREACRKL